MDILHIVTHDNMYHEKFSIKKKKERKEIKEGKNYQKFQSERFHIRVNSNKVFEQLDVHHGRKMISFTQQPETALAVDKDRWNANSREASLGELRHTIFVHIHLLSLLPFLPLPFLSKNRSCTIIGTDRRTFFTFFYSVIDRGERLVVTWLKWSIGQSSV